MERIGKVFRVICKLTLIFFTIAAAWETIFLSSEYHKKRYLSEVELEDEE